MGRYLYCDSCFLISSYQDGYLDSLSRYHDVFYISETQIIGELIRPSDLAEAVRKSINVIAQDRDEIIKKTKELAGLHTNLSFYDCLCMAYSLLDGYCLISGDKALIKKCSSLGIQTKTSKQIKEEFNL